MENAQINNPVMLQVKMTRFKVKHFLIVESIFFCMKLFIFVLINIINM